METDVQMVSADDRVLVKEVMGRRTIWLAPEGYVETAVMQVNVLEMCRVPLDKMPDDLRNAPSYELLAERFAERVESIHGPVRRAVVVHWPETVDFNFPESVGVVLVMENPSDQPRVATGVIEAAAHAIGQFENRGLESSAP